MRKALMLFFCSFSIIASATDYYVSSSGNDSANGQSASTPWQSISKVNSASSGFKAGDRILFKRGDTFKGTLKLRTSGTAGSPIIIGAYGSGDNPVITGFSQVSGWSSYGNGIYSKSLSCESSPNIVLVNGKNTPIGRWPNSKYLSIDSHVSNTSITNYELPSSPSWTGGEVVIRKTQHVWDRNKISNHSGNSIYYQSGSEYHAEDGYGYFIQNHINTLDQLGEWFYNGQTFYMYFGNSNPENYNVRVGTIDQLLSLEANSNITIENITFEGANLYAIQVKDSRNVTIQNCRIAYIGDTGIFGPWWGNSSNCRISNNVIDNCNNNAIRLSGDHNNATVTGNTLTNNGLIVGMGANGDNSYMGINVFADNTQITNNTIRNTGYIGIYFGGNNSVVSNNLVADFDLVKNDGGGIYTWNGNGTAVTGLKITENVVMNGIGFGEATPDKSLLAEGIYLDERSRNVEISKNTIFNCNAAGIYLHNAHEITITWNTIYNNGSGRRDHGCQILFVHDHYSPNDPIRNINMNNNILFARTAEQAVLAFSTTSNDIPSFGNADYNYYARPIDNSSAVARTWSQGWYSQVSNRSLSNWQSFTNKDWNSKTAPVSISDVNKIRFEYNASNSNKAVSLDGSYIDVKGAKYSGTLTLPPYSSVVLIVDPNPSAPPTPPVFTGASVENNAPAVVEMNYNLTLANVVPAASAFSVQVNSAARNVTAVAVSGAKVRLTLASPVAAGNTVTVSYTAPSSNPIQTPAGGKAASISGQSVSNKVTPPAAPVFTGASVENSAPSVVEMNYNLTLANVVPAASAFSVQVNSAARNVTAVAVSGTKVRLTLASPVAAGNTVTVSYTAPSSNPIQTSSGGKAASITGQSVSNKVTPPAAPVFTGASVENSAPSVVEMNYNLSLANIVPAASAFSVQVNSAARNVTAVAVSGTKVRLTLASPVAAGNTVTVSYTAPSSNPIQTSSGGKAASISGQNVSNKVTPPPVPAFKSAVVENSAPSVVVLTFSLSLAAIVPSSSAFAVSVDSKARSVSSVFVSGAQVKLTLSSPVINGNKITVSYTKPSSNPLQTPAGGQVAGFNSQNVTNNVSAVSPPPSVVTPPPAKNDPPVINVNYSKSMNSGFVGNLNASGSFDPDKDNLTYTWKAPANIAVSSTNSPVLEYLAPVVETAQTFEFTLVVSDGKSPQTKVIPVEIKPYQPHLQTAEIVAIETDESISASQPYNILDGNIGTTWSVAGKDQWIVMELKTAFTIHHLKVAFQPNQKKEFYFDLYGSNDKETWEPILSKSKSCSFSGNLQVFDFPASKADKEYKYVKFVGQGNSVDQWNHIAELRIYGVKHKFSAEYEEQIVKVYPNPARDMVNIRIDEPSFVPDFINILTLSGKVIYESILEPDNRLFQIPLNFMKGIYLIQMGKGPITMFTQKLIIIN